MPISIKDIAQKLGISVSAVSKALNDYADVSEATRKRVQENENLLIPMTQETEIWFAAINDLLDFENPPTALFAFNDVIAIEALKIAKDRGLRIPEDVAIAGFDGMYSSLITSPPLTTVKHPVEDIGQKAVEILLDEITHRVQIPQKIILPTELIPRQSTLGRA